MMRVENGQEGTGRPNPSRETKFSGANEDREIFIFPCLADPKQDWQPCMVIYTLAINDDHTRRYLVELCIFKCHVCTSAVAITCEQLRRWLVHSPSPTPSILLTIFFCVLLVLYCKHGEN